VPDVDHSSTTQKKSQHSPTSKKVLILTMKLWKLALLILAQSLLKKSQHSSNPGQNPGIEFLKVRIRRVAPKKLIETGLYPYAVPGSDGGINIAKSQMNREGDFFNG
jgi:hypothetical protein